MKRFLLFLIFLILLTACTTAETADPQASLTPQASITPEPARDSAAPTEAQPQAESGDTVTLTVIYTSDEHGWMAGEEPGQGAAEMAGLWATGYTESDGVVILSGGDNWTGPAISTWFGGEGMIEVMNAMGYHASVVGNHEFDLGLEGLQERVAQANFPFLGANVRYKGSGEYLTDLGIQPYTIVELAGLQIGLIGLANEGTPTVTNPGTVAGFDFLDYAETLRQVAPEVRAAGADLILVPSHICRADLTWLANQVEDLGITLFGGGHCHEDYAFEAGGAILLGGGSNLREFAYANLAVDPATGVATVIDFGEVHNVGGTPHPQIAEIVAHWQGLADAELNVVIGYLRSEISRQSPAMAALITESWLWAYPADVAITNWGGMRDRIPAGEVTYASIISVMPFENVLIDVALTGEQLQQVLAAGHYLPAFGGLHKEGAQWMLESSGAPLNPAQTYHVLVNDFMYAGGDDYGMLASFDPEAYNTAINWRQPVIDWIVAQGSSVQNPLDGAIEGLGE